MPIEKNNLGLDAPRWMGAGMADDLLGEASASSQKAAHEIKNSRAEFAQALATKALVQAKAYELASGRDAHDDPQGVAAGLEALVSARQDRLEWLGRLETEKRSIKAEREASLAKTGASSALDVIVAEFLSREFAPKWPAGAVERWAAQELSLARREDKALWDLTEASGWARGALEEASAARIAGLAGEHLSRMELSFSPDRMENWTRGYALTVSRSSDGSVGGFEKVERSAHVDRLIGRSFDLAESLAVGFRPQGPSGDGRAREALGMALGVRGSWRPRDARPSPRINCSEESVETVEKERLVAAKALEGARAGEFLGSAMDAATRAGDAADALAGRVNDSLGAFYAAKPLALAEFEELGLALGKLTSRTLAEAEASKRARATAWFDEVAGERASDLVSAIWGDDPFAKARLAEVEMVAVNAKKIWGALEGQEALGIFSVRMAETLGLPLSGRDLPMATKAAMRERFGLSEGGWRLLGKLGAQEGSAMRRWIAAVDRANDPMAAFGWSSNRVSAEVELERGRGAAKILALALSACAGRGASANATEAVLVSGLEKLSALKKLASAELVAPEGLSAKEVADEAAARESKGPKLVGRWVEKALSDGVEAAEAALGRAMDWLADAEWGTWRDLPEDPPWSEVSRREKAWHEMVRRRERSSKAEVEWESALPLWEDRQQGYSAVALTDGGMLWDEGKAMRHCVSGYDRWCAKGSRRIFSILKDGARLGTLELSKEDGEWKRGQFLGVCNRPIDDQRADGFVSEVLSAYAKADALLENSPAKMAQREAAALRAEESNRAIDLAINQQLEARLEERRARLAGEQGQARPAPGAG